MNCGFDALPPHGCACMLNTKRRSGLSVFMWKLLWFALIASYGTAKMISGDLSFVRANGPRYVASSRYFPDAMISSVNVRTLSHCAVPVYTSALRYTRARIDFAAIWLTRP